MMSNSVKIIYDDFLINAENKFRIISENELDTTYNIYSNDYEIKNYTNPCELYKTFLDGTGVLFPDNDSDNESGIYTTLMSNENGILVDEFGEESIFTIMLVDDKKNPSSSSGFKFVFDEYNDIYPTSMDIQWLRRADYGIIETKSEKEITPDSANFFFENIVYDYDYVVIKIYSINVPYCRLSINRLDFGIQRIIGSDEITNISLSKSIDMISSSIPLNTATINLQTNKQYLFQKGQKLSMQKNENHEFSAFISSGDQTSKYGYDISGECYFSVMEKRDYKGKVYLNEKASDIISDIFKTANVPYEIDENFEDVELSGRIPYTNCKDALMQVCIACQLVASSCMQNKDKVVLFIPQTNANQTIQERRVMQGVTVSSEDVATKVCVTSHKYTKTKEQSIVYKNESNETQNNIFIKFDEPIYDLIVGEYVDESSDPESDLGEYVDENPDFGEIVECGDNYAIINAKPGCGLSGKIYEHITHVKELNQSESLSVESENKIEITDATLVSSDNIDIVLFSCYNYLIKSRSVNAKIIDGYETNTKIHTVKYGEKKYGQVKYGQNIVEQTIMQDAPTSIGEFVKIPTEYQGMYSGNIISQSYNLNGNAILKECTIK